MNPARNVRPPHARPADAFAQMAGTLAAGPELADPLGALAFLRELLAGQSDPRAVRLVLGLDGYLAGRTPSLEAALGVAVGRGQSNRKPSRLRHRQNQIDTVRDLAGLVSPHNRAAELAALLAARDPRLTVIRQAEDVDALPRSRSSLQRLLRET